MVLCPQNGDRIVTKDYVTSRHPLYMRSGVYVRSGVRLSVRLSVPSINSSNVRLQTGLLVRAR